MNTQLQRIQMRNQTLEAQRVAAEQSLAEAMNAAAPPTKYNKAEIRPTPADWGIVIVDFIGVKSRFDCVTLRAPLGTPRAAQLLQLAQGGAAWANTN